MGPLWIFWGSAPRCPPQGLKLIEAPQSGTSPVTAAGERPLSVMYQQLNTLAQKWHMSPLHTAHGPCVIPPDAEKGENQEYAWAALMPSAFGYDGVAQHTQLF